MALLFAATYPERVTALIIVASMACGPLVPNSPFPRPPFDPERGLRWMRDNWGTGRVMNLLIQHPPDAEAATRALARFERSACTPQMVVEIMRRNFEIDIRPMLSAVSVPTLVMHNVKDPALPVEQGRYLAEHIPGAKYIEGHGDFHASWLPEEMDWIADAVMDFLGGSPKRSAIDRVLATVLFTDIVSSTEHDARVGDRAWRGVLDLHDRLARAAIDRYQGRLIKTTGDGLLATFDGPARAIHCANAIRDNIGGVGLQVRAGLHTGEIELRDGDITGLGVVIARRVCDLAGSGELLASRTVKDLVTGSGIGFVDRGAHALKGVPDDWQLYAVQA
jgi:class 3 adenylate cyclase